MLQSVPRFHPQSGGELEAAVQTTATPVPWPGVLPALSSGWGSKLGTLHSGKAAKGKYLFVPVFLWFEPALGWPQATCQMHRFGQASGKYSSATQGLVQTG